MSQLPYDAKLFRNFDPKRDAKPKEGTELIKLRNRAAALEMEKYKVDLEVRRMGLDLEELERGIARKKGQARDALVLEADILKKEMQIKSNMLASIVKDFDELKAQIKSAEEWGGWQAPGGLTPEA